MLYPYISFRQLKELSDRGNIKTSVLGHEQLELLRYFVEHPGASAYDISPVRANAQKSGNYKNTKNRVRVLLELKLIEIIEEKRSIHKANFCRLSPYGIYYLISNNKVSYEAARALIKHYCDNCLFQFFLFPYIKQDSLLQITDSAVFSHIFEYLQECCQRIKEMLFSIDHTYNQKNGILTHQLYVWDNIPKTEYDTKELAEFLRHKFQWHWVDEDEIRRTEDYNTISISGEGNHALIRLNNERTHAILTLGGRRMYEFIVREGTADEPIIDVYDLMIGNKSIITSVRENAVRNFLIYHNLRIFDLIRSIASSCIRGSSTAEILLKDDRFVGTLERTKRNFDEIFKLV